MTTTDDAPHPNWTETDADEPVVDKYDPRPVTRYERESGPTLWLRPTEPNAQHAETDRYGVSVVREGEEGSEPFVHADGFDDARHVAAAFVEAYEDAAGGVRESIEAGRETAQSADAAVTVSR